MGSKKLFGFGLVFMIIFTMVPSGQPPGDLPLPPDDLEDGGAIEDIEDVEEVDETSEEPVESMTEYASKEYGIYFATPEGWTLVKRPDRGGLFELTDPDGKISIRCICKVVKDRKGIDKLIKDQETLLGLYKRGRIVREMVKDESIPAAHRSILDSLMYDDFAGMAKKKEKWEKNQQKLAEEAAKAGVSPNLGEEATEPSFRRVLETRIYEMANGVTKLTYWVIGGGVAYRFIVEAKTSEFYEVIMTAKPFIDSLSLTRLDGGRYKLPSDEQVRAATKGMVMGKVLSNGRIIPGANIQIYKSKEGYLRGEPKYTTRSNYYGEYLVKSMNPGTYYLVEVSGTSDEGEIIKSVQPIRIVNVGSGKVTFINLEVITK